MAIDCQATFIGTSALILPCNFTALVLAIDISATNRQPTWFKAGYLKSWVNVEGELFSGSQFTLGFGNQLIQIPYLNYQLEFQPVVYLQNTTIKIKQLSVAQRLNIMPNYASFPTSITEQPVLDSLPTSFTAPQYLLATLPAAYQCLPANFSRQSFAVTNLGNVPVFLDLDAPSAANKRFIAIAAGGTYVSDFPYVGAVFIWSTNATAQACEIREFIQ